MTESTVTPDAVKAAELWLMFTEAPLNFIFGLIIINIPHLFGTETAEDDTLVTSEYGAFKLNIKDWGDA